MSKEQARRSPALFVGIGLSAGGQRPLELLLDSLPAGLGCCLVVVSHRSPEAESVLEQSLARRSVLPVRVAEDGVEARSDTLYLAPPRTLLTLEEGRFRLGPSSAGGLPIDHFFDSLSSLGSRAAVVLLSGAGCDGAEGARRVSRAGGLVLLQEPADAEYGSVLEAATVLVPGAVVAGVDQMPGRLLQAMPDPQGDTGWNLPLLSLLNLLRQRTGADFRQHSPHRIGALLQGRGVVDGEVSRGGESRTPTLPRSSLDELCRALLGGEAGFFREPQLFESLRRQFVEPLVQRCRGQEVRVWMAGCACGEEAYSLAILFDEVEREQNVRINLNLFATDPQAASIERAARGLYFSETLDSVSAERLHRYFQPLSEGEFLIDPELRRRLVFARHDFLEEPPFPRLDLIWCRNLLAGLQPAAQEAALRSLAFGLRSGGALVLEPGEAPECLDDWFEPLDGAAGLYLKRASSSEVQNTRAGGFPRGRWAGPAELKSRLDEAYEQLFEEHLGDGLLIDSSYRILQFLGDASGYLLPERGRNSQNLLPRCDRELRQAVSILVPRTIRNGISSVARSLKLRFREAERLVDVIAQPLGACGPERIVWLCFQPSAAPSGRVASEQGPSEESSLRQRLAEVEHELINTRDNLRLAVEELRLRNEQLETANRAMLAINDDLQASNDGLSCLNSELVLVNREFERKNSELSALGDDLQNLLNSLQVGVLFLDRNLCLRRFNPLVEQNFRLRAQDLGRPLGDLVHLLSSGPELVGQLRRVLETGKPFQAEVRSQTKGRWMLQRLLPFRDSTGEIGGVVLTYTDIHVGKQLEARLAQAHRAARLAWWEWTPNDDRVYWHGDYYTVLGSQERELPSTRTGWMTLVHPDDRPEIRLALRQATPGTLPALEVRCLRGDGSYGWLQICGQRARTSRDRWVGTVLDVTARREAQHESRRQAAILSNIGVAVVCLNRAGEVTYWNQEATDLLGSSAEEMIGKAAEELLGQGDGQSYFQRGLAGETVRGELTRTKPGSRLWIDFTVAPMRGPLGESVGTVFVLRDVSEDRRLREQLRRDTQILESIRDSVIEVDGEGNITFWSRGAAEMLGWSEEEALDRKLEFRYPSLLRPRMAAFFQGLLDDLSGAPVELQDLCRDGSARWVLWRGWKLDGPLGGAIFFGTDVDEQRRLLEERQAMQQQLFQSQKMEVLGTLAGGIAHDFNNLLATMLGNTEHALRSGEATERAEALQDVMSAGTRARDLVRRLLSFARQEEPARTSVDLVAVVEEVYKLLRSSFSSSLEMHLSCPRRPVWVNADATQMHQVMMNFCSNAADAMEHRGELSLMLTEEELSEETVFLTGSMPAGCYAMLCVSDTGEGIPAHQLPRLFDPFFTTKEPGKGTGLGLSIVHGIVKAHGGAVDVQTAPGRGTTFTIYLPLLQEPLSQAVVEEASAEESESATTIDAAILVLDDEESVARMTVRQLASLGYQAIYTLDPVEARDRLLEGSDGFRLLITDISMPVLTGVDLALALRERGNDTPVLLTSGYAPDTLPGALAPYELLTKPFSREELASSLRSLLQASSEG